MVDMKAAVEYVTGKAPSVEWIERMGKIRLLLGWQQGDPFADAIAILDAEIRLLSGGLRQISAETAGILKRVHEVSESEIVSCKGKMALVTAEMKSKMVNDVVPQVSERVAIAASEQIARMSIKISVWRAILLLSAAVFALIFVFTIGFFIAETIPLLDFLAHVNTSIYTIKTVIEASVSQIGVALIVACMIFGCLAFAVGVTLWSKDDCAVFLTWGTAFSVIMSCIFIWWSFFVNAPNIQIVTEKSAAPALFSAIRSSSNPELIKDIIATGVSVNVKDDNGITPLMLAAMMNPNPEIIKMLASFGANLNTKDKDGNTPLLFAISSNPNPEIVTALIGLGGDVNAARNDGRNAVLTAITNTSHDVATPLIEAGIDVNEKYGENKYTALMAAAIIVKTPEIISILIKHGARVNEQNEPGKTALMYAARHTSNPDVIKTLINAKADINAIDGDGNTAFDLAQQNENLKKSEVLQLLKPSKK